MKFLFLIFILEYNGDIIWYNYKFLNIVKNKKLIGKNFKDEFFEFYLVVLEGKNKIEKFEYEGVFFDVLVIIVEVEEGKNEKRFLNLFYFVDVIDFVFF